MEEHEILAHLANRPRLGAKETGLVDDRFDIRLLRRREIRNRRIARKQDRRDRVDIDVGRLGTEDHRNQQLPRIPKVQLRARLAVLELQTLHDNRRPLPSPHRQPPLPNFGLGLRLRRSRCRANRLRLSRRITQVTHLKSLIASSTRRRPLATARISIQPQRDIASTRYPTPVATSSMPWASPAPTFSRARSRYCTARRILRSPPPGGAHYPRRVASRGQRRSEGRRRDARSQKARPPAVRPTRRAARGPR